MNKTNLYSFTSSPEAILARDKATPEQKRAFDLYVKTLNARHDPNKRWKWLSCIPEKAVEEWIAGYALIYGSGNLKE